MLGISMFGGLRIVAGGRLVTGLHSPRAQMLLAYLVLHRQAPQPRRHLAFLFWPDSTEAQARTNLRRELHALRRGVPGLGRHLHMDGPALWWREDVPVELDVAAFEDAVTAAERAAGAGDRGTLVAEADRAARAYGGDLLPGFYEEWVLEERERLHRACVSVLDRLVRALSAAGDVGSAVVHARHRVALEPLEESGYATLIDLEGRAGNRAAAMRTFHQCASMVERELGAGPGPGTIAAYERVMAAAPAGSSAPASPPPPEPPAATPLVGRRREQATLSAAWRSEGARLVAIQGEAGIGKTRLADWLCRHVERSGAPVAGAACVATYQRVALSPVSAWFRHPALAAAARGLAEPCRRDALRLVGDDDATAPRPAMSDPLSSGWHRARLYEALARALAALPQRMLLFLDDLQWCDGETLDWLAFLFRAVPGAPVLVVVTVRVEELAEPSAARAALRTLRGLGVVTEVDVGPLREDEVADLAGRTLGRPLEREEAARMHDATGGFPLFVVEGAELWADAAEPPASPPAVRGLPPRARAVLHGRLAPLGPAARELLELVAVVGGDVSLELLAEGSDSGEQELVAAIDELWRRRLVRASGPGVYDVSHDLIRDALLEELSPPRRWLLHRRAARALERLHQGRGDDVMPARIAFHHEQSGQHGLAARFELAAAAKADRVFAAGDAVRRCRHALELIARLPESVDRDRLELDARFQMVAPLNAMEGYASSALRANLERASELAARLDDERLLVQCLIGLWAASFVQGDIRRSAAVARQALDRSRRHPDLAAQTELGLGGSLTSLGRTEEGVEHLDRAAVLDAPHDQPATVFGFRPAVMALAWRAHGLCLVGRGDDAGAVAEQAVALADGLDHPYSRTVAHAYAAITWQIRGDRAAVLAHARAADDLCRRYGFGYYGDWAAILRGWADGGAGGAASIRAALARLREQRADTRRPYYLGLLAEVLIALGRSADAAAALDEAEDVAARNDDRWSDPVLHGLAERVRR